MRSPQIESVLTSLKVKFEYVPEMPLVKLISDQQTQVRLPANQAPSREVTRYRDLLQHGAEFPPVVILKDGRVVDGNTRWAAFDQARRVTLPAYVCEISSPQIARRIGMELNAVHGKRMTKEELANWISAGNGSIGEEDALRLTGWSGRTVKRVRASLQFESRRTKLGVKLTAALPGSVKEHLNGVQNPDVFRDLTMLAHDAALTAGETKAIADKANETALTDVPAALKIIAEFRGDNGQRIEERAAGMRASTPIFQQLSMHIGWLVSKGASGLFDGNAHTGPKSQALLEEGAVVIADALERY